MRLDAQSICVLIRLEIWSLYKEKRILHLVGLVQDEYKEIRRANDKILHSDIEPNDTGAPRLLTHMQAIVQTEERGAVYHRT